MLLTVLSLAVLAAAAVLLAPSRYTAYAAFGLLGLGMGATGVQPGLVALCGFAALSSLLAVRWQDPRLQHGAAGSSD